VLCAVYLPVWGVAIVSVLTVGGAAQVVYRDALLASAQSIITLQPGYSGLDYQFKNGDWRRSTESGSPHSSFVSRWLSVIAVRDSDTHRRRYVVLMPDSMDPEAARRVRVWLKWHRVEENRTEDF
jgi:hypothetical protein